MLAALILCMYVIAGIVHAVADIDVAKPSGDIVISMADKGAGNTEKSGIVAHHCHGCFSVSVPTPLFAVATIEPTSVVVSEPLLSNSRLGPGIDTPPPKLLT